jgi:p-cymene monooxygenase electron transfer component
VSLLRKLFRPAVPHAVTLRPSGAAFDVPAGETVLERALKEGIAFPHDCTVGTCGSCRSRLLEGKVEAITPFGYTLCRAEMDDGFILACQALAKSALTLEVDLSAVPPIDVVTRTATLVILEQLTHDIRKATFELDGPIEYRAGQYANFGWPGDTRARSYSFSQAPLPNGSTCISTFIRLVPGGGFTGHIFSDAAWDGPYTVEGPHGNFWLRDGTGPILCIAGGSGLAPILSLLSDASTNVTGRDCILLFGARGERDLYAQKEIAAIARQWAGRFDFIPVVSDDGDSDHAQGLVTDHIAAALRSLGGAPQAYLCGPPGMIDAGIQALTQDGIPLGDIHYDKFTDAGTTAAASG